MTELPYLYQIFIWAVPVIFAVTLHEVGHGIVAKILGDTTAEDMGRLTINPIKHIDLIGTIVVPVTMFFLSGFVFGWAKPVPINWNRLRNKKRDIALVALAGPFANLLMIIFWLFVAKLFIGPAGQGNSAASLLTFMAWAGIIINFLLMIVNLLPLPPLDGSRVLFSVLPNKLAYQYIKLEKYGLLILVVLLITGVLEKTIGPIIAVFERLMHALII